MTRPVIAIWDADRCYAVRTLLPFVSRNKHGELYSSVPEIYKVTTERVGCKCCGCPIDPGVEALRVLVFTGYESRKAPRYYINMHRHDCWNEGFVQTLQLHGQMGVARLRKNNRTYDAFYDMNKIKVVEESGNDGLGSIPSINNEPEYLVIPFMFIKDTGIRIPKDLIKEQELARKDKAKAKYEKKKEDRQKAVNAELAAIDAIEDEEVRDQAFKEAVRPNVKTYDTSAD